MYREIGYKSDYILSLCNKLNDCLATYTSRFPPTKAHPGTGIIMNGLD